MTRDEHDQHARFRKYVAEKRAIVRQALDEARERVRPLIERELRGERASWWLDS